jgi:YidC/Oxa1 family membrane protein insertase
MGSEQRNALLAVVLSGLILFGWQYYFAPPMPVDAPIEPTAKTEIAPTATPESAAGPIEPVAAESFSLVRDQVKMNFTSKLAVNDFENQQAAFSFTDTVGSKKPLRVEFDFGNGFQSVNFAQTADNKYFNAAHDMTLVTNITEEGVMNFNITSPNEFRYRFVFNSEPRKLENGQQRYFSFYTDDLTHEEIGEEENGDRNIKWAGIDFNYHLFAVYFEKEATLIYRMTNENNFSMFSNKAQKSLSYNLVFVKKEYNYLAGLGNNLKNSVDFGVWGFFAVWILKGLQFFFKFFPNYGVAIILLTLLVRTITFPLQYKSFVSMKKLQLVQPELTKIREKFKDDPQRMQKESMELFRKSGANPLGGCLPLLLQMPVFFAFYKVLYSAVELVDAPFILWIQDLSNKDPYFVLPVLMTGAMFLQQKLTPNTISDPVQKKVMMFMPLVFGFIMKDLPSGLSLYIFVSTIFGILQQVLVFRAKNKPVVV